MKIIEGNDLIVANAKENYKLNDKQMECFLTYLKANYPEAKYSNDPIPKSVPAAKVKEEVKESPFKKVG